MQMGVPAALFFVWFPGRKTIESPAGTAPAEPLASQTWTFAALPLCVDALQESASWFVVAQYNFKAFPVMLCVASA